MSRPPPSRSEPPSKRLKPGFRPNSKLSTPSTSSSSAGNNRPNHNSTLDSFFAPQVVVAAATHYPSVPVNSADNPIDVDGPLPPPLELPKHVTLNDEQYAIFKLVSNGENIFFTGPAG